MRLRDRVRRFFDGSMRANAFALVANQLTSASLGFVYWLLAARLYPVEVVGTSTAVISTIQLVSGLAQLGLVSGMQRFIPRAGRRARSLAGSAYAVAATSAAAAGFLALGIASAVAPDGSIFSGIGAGWVVLAAVAWTLFYLQDGVLIGLREAVWVLIENFAYNLSKIILLVIAAGVLVDGGIVASWFAPAPFAVMLVSWLLFGRLLRPERLRDQRGPEERVTAREFVTSVSADHVGGLVAEAGLRVLPLLVIRLAGVEATAYFYQAWMISTVLGLVASGMANSFTAETAADRRQVGPNSRAILRAMSMLLLPAALLTGLAAPLVLGAFGDTYAREGTGLLQLLALAVIPVIINTWYVSYLRVMGRVRRLVGVRVVSSVALVSLSYAGLQFFGIAGVGAAWLTGQLGMAIFAFVDARHVLTGNDSHNHKGTSLRCGDWRFLLPVPHPSKVAVLSGGGIAECASLSGGMVLESERSPGCCDLAVTERPDTRRLAGCFSALEPGGLCYAEWRGTPLRSIRAVRSRLRATGFEEPLIYWPAPSFRHPRLWVRAPVPSPEYRTMLTRLIERSAHPAWLGRAAATAAALAVRIGFVPSLVSLARKPGATAGKVASHDFCQWLEARLAARTGRNVGLTLLMRTGGSSDENKINWLVFDGDGDAPRWIAKASRHPASVPALEAEYETLRKLSERSGAGAAAVRTPEAVLRTEEPGFPLYVQGALNGTPLLVWAARHGYATAAERLSRALAEFADGADPVPSNQWRDSLVEPWLTRLSEQLTGLGDDGLVEHAREALEELGPLPLVWTHNDCTPWNTVVTTTGLGMFDWETADEHGLPAVDLIYCLSTTAFSLDGTASTPRAAESYARLLDPLDERGAAFSGALAAYGDALGLAEDDISRLRIVTWLVHATHDLHNLLADADTADSSLLARCVCLPVLRLEVERHRSRMRPEMSDHPVTEALFISPHLDDAVLSCGSAIARLARTGARVWVVTVFTADLAPDMDPSPLAMRCHETWGGGDAPFSRRREEDRAAVSLLGAEPVHLGFLDAVYRTDGRGKPWYPATQRGGTAAPDERACVQRIAERLREVLGGHPRATVFCPAGIGGHVDHTIVRTAVESLGAPHIIYYDEYPYFSWTKSAHHATRRPPSLVLRATRMELEARVAATHCYASQIPGLFPSLPGRVYGMLREQMPRVVAWLPPRPGHARRSLRRMAERLGRDGERYGERYSWSDPAWAGPFVADRSGSVHPDPVDLVARGEPGVPVRGAGPLAPHAQVRDQVHRL